jgi:uncharacterized protein YjbI with pentapeptide repeats
VIGNAIDQETSAAESERLRKLLYGDSLSGASGAVTRYQKDLTALKLVLPPNAVNLQSVDLSLQATREAIRLNWENLEFGMFAEHDLTGIDLYKAKAHGAYFGKAILVAANLCGADLSQANFEQANLSYADLYQADISSTYRWKTANLEGANIRDVKNAPADFTETARKYNTFDLP